MLGAMLPEDVRPARPPLPLVDDPDRVVFYVPRYMGPVADLELMSRMPNLRGRAAADGRVRRRAALRAAGRDPVQRRRRPRRQHGRARGRTDPRLAARPRRVRPGDAVGSLAVRPSRGARGQARAGDRRRWRGSRGAAPTGALRDRRHDGRADGPAGSRRHRRRGRAAAHRGRRGARRAAHRGHDRTGRRRLPVAHARRCPPRERRTRDRWSTPMRSCGTWPWAGSARRSTSPIPSRCRRAIRCGPCPGCSSARTWAATPRRSCRVPEGWSRSRCDVSPRASRSHP